MKKKKQNVKLKSKSTAKKAAPKKTKRAKAGSTVPLTPEEKHRKFIADIEKVLKTHGFKEALAGISLRPLILRCDPPCPPGTRCVRRVDPNTNEEFYVCERI